MGIDLDRHHVRKHVSKTARGSNPYMKLLVRLYKFLARRTQAKFPAIVLHRLCLSRVNRPVMSTSMISKYMKRRADDYTAVVVATVTNDERYPVKKNMKVCALRFTRNAEKAIVAAGGECIKLDELALRAPTGRKTVLLRGRKNTRKALKHFGKVCAKKNPAKQYKGKGYSKKH